jgi:hypothetical protein
MQSVFVSCMGRAARELLVLHVVCCSGSSYSVAAAAAVVAVMWLSCSIFTLIMLVIFESTVCAQRLVTFY